MSKEVTITVDEMKQLIATAVSAAVEAARKPNELEQRELDRQQKEIEAKQQERLANAELQKQQIAEKKALQEVCLHEHKNGKSHCVYITNGDYILCQKCQKITRRNEPQLFNRLFQASSTSSVD